MQGIRSASAFRGRARLTVAAVVTALTVALTGGAKAQTPLKMGALLATTGSAAEVGSGAALGARMALQEINGGGGIRGRQVKMVQADDAGDTTQAVNETKRLVFQEKVEVMLGPLFSPSTIAMANAVAAANPQITYWSFATSGQVTPKLASTLFAYGPPTDALSSAMVDYAVDVRKSKAIGILADTAAQSALTLDLIKNRLAERGVTPAGIDRFQVNDKDVTPQLLTLRRQNVDFILYQAAVAADTANVLKNIDELGWDVQIAANNGGVISYSLIASNAGPAAVKHLVAGAGIKPFTYCTGDAVGSSDYAKFLVRLKAFAPDMNPSTPLTNVIEMYDIVYIVKAAVEAVGATDGKAMTEWLEAHSDQLHPIAAYPHFSPTNHFIALADSLTMVENLGNIRSDGLLKRAGC